MWVIGGEYMYIHTMMVCRKKEVWSWGVGCDVMWVMGMGMER